MTKCAVCNKKHGFFARAWNTCKECGHQYCPDCTFPIFQVVRTRSPFGPG